MAYVPKPLHPESFEYGERPMSGGASFSTITIYALSENKRPIGFAPWPPEKKRKKRKKRKTVSVL